MLTAANAKFALAGSSVMQVPARERATDMVTYPANPDAFLPGNSSPGRLSAESKILYVAKIERMFPSNLDVNVRKFLTASNGYGAERPAAAATANDSWLTRFVRERLGSLLPFSHIEPYEYLLISQYPNAQDRLNVEMMVYNEAAGRPSRSFYRTSSFTFEVLEKNIVVSLNVFNASNGPFRVRTNKAYWIMDENWPKFSHYAEHQLGQIYFPIENFPEFIATIRQLGWQFY